MRDKLKDIRLDFLLSSLFSILAGVLLIIGRADVVNILGTVLAVMMIIVGAVDLSGYFLSFITGGASMVVGAVLVVLGLWCLFNPAFLLSLIPVAIGIFMVVLGVRSLKNSIDSRKYGNSSWLVNLLLAIISILLGLLCAFDAFGVLENAVALVGIILIFIGLSNLWSGITSSRGRRDYRNRCGSWGSDNPDIIDVEFKDDNK